jgi:hypothetical protein
MRPFPSKRTPSRSSMRAGGLDGSVARRPGEAPSENAAGENLSPAGAADRPDALTTRCHGTRLPAEARRAHSLRGAPARRVPPAARPGQYVATRPRGIARTDGEDRVGLQGLGFAVAAQAAIRHTPSASLRQTRRYLPLRLLRVGRLGARGERAARSPTRDRRSPRRGAPPSRRGTTSASGTWRRTSCGSRRGPPEG